MLAEKKVILMTRMVMFRQREGRRDNDAGRYFSVDYITHHIIGSVVCATLVFVVVCALYVFSHFDLIMQDIYSADLMAFLKKTVDIYVKVVAVYCVFSGVIYAVKYYHMQKRIKKYSAGLRHLMDMTENEGE